jgi:predicted RNA-binding Zn ribbon-like protein
MISGVDVEALSELIEEKVAPEPLIAVQGLANTYSFEDDEELLLDPAAARDWLVESDLAAPGIAIDDAGLARLIDCRRVIRELIAANHDGEPNPEAAAQLSRLAAQHPVGLAAGADGRLALDLEPPSSVDRVIGQMVGIVFCAQLESQWPRLKICAADDCRWAFYDRSRNRGGNWCQMGVCGNRAKNRAYRARHAH